MAARGETPSPSDAIRPCRAYTFLNEDGARKIGESRPDWKGIGKDTAYLIGYESIYAGFLYFMPKSVSDWTDEQKRCTGEKWWENVQHPAWDRDPWWVNYAGHPYFGAVIYIRGRERGLSTYGSFLYSVFLSSLWEYGVEAFFEPPSYQDLIVTPVAGTLIGTFLFEPLRESIKGKQETS